MATQLLALLMLSVASIDRLIFNIRVRSKTGVVGYGVLALLSVGVTIYVIVSIIKFC